MDIQGKIAIITGASAGIGLATARLFARNGANVVLAARSADFLEQLSEELSGSGVETLVAPTDLRDERQVHRMVEQTVEHFGRVDVLVNNAGQSVAGTIAGLNPDDLRQVIDLNILGPVYAMQAAIQVMRRQGGGLIANISSMTSKMAIPGLGGYAATKAALNVLSRTARAELAGENIRVITIYPRMTATDFGKNALGDQQMRQRQRNPAHTVQVDTPEHVADRILAAVRDEPEEQYME